MKPLNETVNASLVTIDASATIGFEAFGNAFTIDNFGAGNVVDVVDVVALATVVVVADEDAEVEEDTVVDGALTVGVVTVGVVVVDVVDVGVEPTPGAATCAASRMNHDAAELGAIIPEVALLVPTPTH